MTTTEYFHLPVGEGRRICADLRATTDQMTELLSLDLIPVVAVEPWLKEVQKCEAQLRWCLNRTKTLRSESETRLFTGAH